MLNNRKAVLWLLRHGAKLGTPDSDGKSSLNRLIEVFIETTTWLASYIGIIPSRAQVNKSLSLPSWVPDWSVHFRLLWMFSLSGLFYPLKASLDSQFVAKFLTSLNLPPELKVRGLEVDRIRSLTDILDIRKAGNTAISTKNTPKPSKPSSQV
jgi:hypothetical protein